MKLMFSMNSLFLVFFIVEPHLHRSSGKFSNIQNLKYDKIMKRFCINEIFQNWLTYFINQVHNGSQLLKRRSLVDNTRGGHERKLDLDTAVVERRQDKGRRKFDNHQNLLQGNGQANIASKNTIPTGRSHVYVLNPVCTLPQRDTNEWEMFLICLLLLHPIVKYAHFVYQIFQMGVSVLLMWAIKRGKETAWIYTGMAFGVMWFNHPIAVILWKVNHIQENNGHMMRAKLTKVIMFSFDDFLTDHVYY